MPVRYHTGGGLTSTMRGAFSFGFPVKKCLSYIYIYIYIYDIIIIYMSCVCEAKYRWGAHLNDARRLFVRVPRKEMSAKVDGSHASSLHCRPLDLAATCKKKKKIKGLTSRLVCCVKGPKRFGL